MPSSVHVTPNQSDPAFSSALATSGPPCPYPFPLTMERILRGDLRFSCTGFTYLRIASRLYASASSETSAHTGRRTSLRGLFCVPAMGLPNKIVYAIRAASARCQPHSLPRERQPLFHCNPKALQIRRQPESPYFFLTSEKPGVTNQGLLKSKELTS